MLNLAKKDYEPNIYLTTSYAFMSRLLLTTILLVTSSLVAGLPKEKQCVKSLS